MNELDINQIITDWFFKLEKGYSEYPCSEEDLEVLKEVILSRGNSYEDFSKIKEKLSENRFLMMEKPDPEKNRKIREMIDILSETGLSESLLSEVEKKLRSIDSDRVESIYKNFRSMTLSNYIKSGYQYFTEFFDIGGTEIGTGRGEVMAIMAIKGSESGGKYQKDLKIGGKFWEVKELEGDGFRLAKSGDSSKTTYVKEIRKFYDLLEKYGMLDTSRDKSLIRNLKSLFNEDSLAQKVYEVISKNFRGDGKIYRDGYSLIEKSSTAREMGQGVIESHYQGFIFLKKIKSKISKRPEVINTVRMSLKSSSYEKDYYISSSDAEKIRDAESNAKVTIRKGETAGKEDLRSFIISFLKIMDSSLVRDPDLIPKNFTDLKREFFSSDVEAIVYHHKSDPKPNLGRFKDFKVNQITQGQIKFVLSSRLSSTKSMFVAKQE